MKEQTMKETTLKVKNQTTTLLITPVRKVTSVALMKPTTL